MPTLIPTRPRALPQATSRADFVSTLRTATRAFSLIELIVVIAVLAIASTIAIPRYASAACHFNADAAARRIASDFDMTASLARSSGKTQTVLFDTSGSGSNTYSVSNAVRLDRRSGTYTVDLKNTYGASIVSASFGAGSLQASFDCYGGSNGGSIIIHVGTYQKTVSLDANSASTIQ